MSKQKYKLRVNVVHNGKELLAGSACPAEFVSALASQGLLEPVGEVVEPKAVDPVVEPPKVLSDDLEVPADAKEGGLEESEEDESEDLEEVPAAKVETPKKPVPRKVPQIKKVG